MTVSRDEARALLDALERQRPAMLATLEELVRHESPSRDKPALDGLADRLAARLESLGAAVTRHPNDRGGDHLVARFRGASDEDPPGVVLGHFDTVWPIGTLARMAWRVESGSAWGPGVYDMKAGLVATEFALRAILTTGLTVPRPVVVVWTSDEEIGSPTSRRLIEETARGAAYALVPEPPLGNGGLKTARKGVGRFTVQVEGRAAHAGVEPEKGVSAVVELAHQILAAQALADPASGSTVNVGVIRGGTTTNVVPASATADVDVRATTLAEASRLEAGFLGMTPVTPGAVLKVSGAFNRPPMERTPAIAALFDRAREAGRALGLDLTEGSTGGGSDGNFTAALGVPTLDGLGIPGAGAHADHEHIDLAELTARTALLAMLLRTL